MRFAVAALLVALATIGVAAPASADEAECATISLRSGGYELFPVEQRYLPPPLRAFPADCAARVSTRDVENAFILVYANSGFEQFIDIMRSFENANWIVAPSISYIDGSGVRDTGKVDSTTLAAVGSDVRWATARFSRSVTGDDIISVTYTDGVSATNNDPSLTTPSIYIDVWTERPYVATGLADPSVLSSLRTIGEVTVNAVTASVVGGSAVVLMLIVGYPGVLLGGVLSERYDQLVRWIARTRGARRPPSTLRVQSRRPGWLIYPGLALAALISGFVDPAFGPNPMSLRVFLSALVTLLLFNFAAWSVVRAIIRRLEPDANPVIGFRWGSLVLLLIAVAIARLLQFQPGVIFGLVAGLVFAVALSESRKATTVLLGSGFALAISLIAWVAYSVVAPITQNAPGNVALVSASELLSALTLEGISALPLALLPLLALDGRSIFAWKRWVWAIAYVVGLAAFMTVLLTVPESWGEVAGDFGRWVLIYIVFGVVAVAVWAVNAAVGRRKHAREPAAAT